MKLMLFLLILGALIVGLIGPSAPSAEAKGLVNQIVISGNGLEKEIIVTDAPSVLWLSTGGLEDFQNSLPEVPQNLGEGYLIERQVRERGGMFNVDAVMYYPNPAGKRGIVHSFQNQNRLKPDDLPWFYATEIGERILQARINHPNLSNTLISFGAEGILSVLYPDTLEIIGSINLPVDDWAYTGYVQSSMDGRMLYFDRETNTGIEGFRLDLEQGELCSVGQASFVAYNEGEDLSIWAIGPVLQLRDGQTLEVVDTIPLKNASQHLTFYPSPLGLEIYITSGSQSGQSTLSVFNIQTRLESSLTEVDFPIDFAFWDMGYVLFMMVSGTDIYAWMPWDDKIYLEGRFKPENLPPGEDSGVFVHVAGGQSGSLFAYPRVGRFTLSDFDMQDYEAGIIVENAYAETQAKMSRWFPQIGFYGVVHEGLALYGLEADSDTDFSTIYGIDSTSGDIFAQQTMPVDTNRIHIGLLDTTSLSPEMKIATCSLSDGDVVR